MMAIAAIKQKRHAVLVFHELAPAFDFGLAKPTGINDRQLAFVRRAAPGLIEVALESGDTDALSEALVSAALLGRRDSEVYHEGLAALLARQHPDGTYSSIHDRAAPGADDYRHVVALTSWALLTSLDVE